MANEVENYAIEAITLGDTDYIDLTKDIGGGNFQSQKMTILNVKAELGLIGNEGFLPVYTTGNQMGTESNIYQDSDGLIGINTGAGSFDAFLTVNYPGGLPNPTYLFDFGSVADGGLRMGRLGAPFFGGYNYNDPPYKDETFRMNFNKYLYRFGQTGDFHTSTYKGVNWQGGGGDMELQLMVDNIRGSSLYFDRDGNYAALRYNVFGSSGLFKLEVDSVDVWDADDTEFKVYVSRINTPSLPTYADDTAAGVGGLVQGDQYQTATGELRIKL